MKKRILPFVLALTLLLSGCMGNAKSTLDVVTISMPYTDYIQNIDTNYYKTWLENKTGLRIQISFITEDYTDEYLRLLFSSENSGVDGVFFPAEQELSLRERMNQYGKEGRLLALNDLIEREGENISAKLDSFEEYDLSKVLQADDGNIYYIPSLLPSKATRNAQSMWMNSAWLKAVNLRPPRSTEELRQVLVAFLEQDPNGNGLRDEVPMLGGGVADKRNPVHFILNAFVYNDPWNAYLAVRNGEVYFPPITDQWREAMIYLRDLYQTGLIPDFTFELDDEQLSQLALDGRSLVGCFTGGGASDVLGYHSPEVLANYINVAPLEGPAGVRWAVASTTQPLVGGVITASAQNPEAVFRLMDLMMSTEASLIGQYGEQGVDWETGQPGNMDIFGLPAALHVKNQLQDQAQNKTLAGVGPAALPEIYSDSITWSGFQSDHEYMNARAFISSQPYMPQEYMRLLHFTGEDAQELGELHRRLEDFVERSINDFMTGVRNPCDDTEWESYLHEFDMLELKRFIGASQRSYEEVDKR